MTQEEKLLLLEDLGSRLMYGVIVDYKDDEYDHHKWKITTLFAPAYSQDGTLIDTDHEGWIGYDDYKGCGMSSGTRTMHLEKNLPFLRSLSSMTKSERKEFDDLSKFDEDVWMGNHKVGFPKNVRIMSKCVDWLNRKMFDHRGLIPKGLALEAPEGMYS